MRLKLDENIPADASVVARELGHDVDTVNAEGLTGALDVDVLAAASGDGRLLLTLDRGFGDVGPTRPALTPASSCSARVPRTRQW